MCLLSNINIPIFIFNQTQTRLLTQKWPRHDELALPSSEKRMSEKCRSKNNNSNMSNNSNSVSPLTSRLMTEVKRPILGRLAYWLMRNGNSRRAELISIIAFYKVGAGYLLASLKSTKQDQVTTLQVRVKIWKVN